MADITVGREFYEKLGRLGREKGYTAETMAHKLLMAGVDCLEGRPLTEQTPEFLRQLNQEIAGLLEIKTDLGHVGDDIGTTVKMFELVRDKIEQVATASGILNEILNPGPDHMPVPELDPERPGFDRSCELCIKQPVCGLYEKMNAVTTHPSVSLAGHWSEQMWFLLAQACDEFWHRDKDKWQVKVTPMQQERIDKMVFGIDKDDPHPADFNLEDHRVGVSEPLKDPDSMDDRHPDAETVVRGDNAPRHRRVTDIEPGQGSR